MPNDIDPALFKAISNAEKMLRKLAQNKSLSYEDRIDARICADGISIRISEMNLDEAIQNAKKVLARSSRPPSEPNKCRFCGCILANDELNRGVCDSCGEG